MQVLELVQTGPVRMWISGKIITRVDISMSLANMSIGPKLILVK